MEIRKNKHKDGNHKMVLSRVDFYGKTKETHLSKEEYEEIKAFGKNEMGWVRKHRFVMCIRFRCVSVRL